MQPAPTKIRNIFISLFVIIWLGLFHYESTRFFYLNPLFGRVLPKTKLLFPPAGWIMFFKLSPTYSRAEISGYYKGQKYTIDPHDIFRTPAVLYDNIHRNVTSTVLGPSYRRAFCKYLRRRFPQYDRFEIAVVYYPDLNDLSRKHNKVLYRC